MRTTYTCIEAFDTGYLKSHIAKQFEYYDMHEG